MVTKRLYYEDCYLIQFPAQVLEAADNGRKVYLDSTAFYPTSGGQPNDLGTLSGQPVLDVIDEGDRIAHVLAAPLDTDAPVTGRVDWLRRYDHMQQHTGQHLLSAVFLDVLIAPTLSFHMGADVSTIELELKELTDVHIDKVETEANAIVWQARQVQISFQDAESVEGLRKASERAGVLRIVAIDGLDKSACGGTHVRSTAELGPIQILRWEKLRGNVRVEFVCGGRALWRSRQERRILMQLSRTTSMGISDIEQYVSAMKERLAETEKAQQRVVAELAKREGEEAYAKTQPSEDGLRRWYQQAQSIDEALRAKAQAFAKMPKAIALAAGSDPAGVLIACSADSGINAGALLKEVLSAAGGRGGGSATLAQGALPAPAVLAQLRTKLGFDA